jgi:hypothetical protein
MASALTSHFASPGKAIRSFPEALDSFSRLKAPRKSGFDAGRMGGFSRSPRLIRTRFAAGTASRAGSVLLQACFEGKSKHYSQCTSTSKMSAHIPALID